MATTKRWDVQIFLGEHDDGSTFAEARLTTHTTAGLRAVGEAHLSPSDVNVPEIGDELAAARALRALADELLRVATEDVENVTHESVHLRSR